MGDAAQRVRYVAVARLDDRLPIATYAATDTRDMPKALLDKKLERVLGSGRVSQHTRLTITDREVGSIHYDTDPTCLFLVVCEPDYLQRTAFKLLSELRTVFSDGFADDVPGARHSSLSRPARDTLRALCDKYNNVANVDKVAAISVQVDAVKSTMQDNINTVLRNTENIETLLDQTHAMKNEASGFQRTAGRVKQKMWWQNFKMQLLIGILIIILIIVIVVPIVARNKNSNKQPASPFPPKP
eukprot:IDg14299t1